MHALIVVVPIWPNRLASILATSRYGNNYRHANAFDLGKTKNSSTLLMLYMKSSLLLLCIDCWATSFWWKNDLFV